MKVYLSGWTNADRTPRGLPAQEWLFKRCECVYRLMSFELINSMSHAFRFFQEHNDVHDVFLDSGAFSFKTRGLEVNLDDYISFIHENLEWICVYAGLDVIGDAEATWENQLEMEKQGLFPLWTYHQGEDIRFFERAIERYDYIALGGLVGSNRQTLYRKWLKPLFNHPKMKGKKVHGFGVTANELLFDIPFYSVDSTTWMMAGAFGTLHIPKRIISKYLPGSKATWTVAMSQYRRKQNDHFSNQPAIVRRVIRRYLTEIGMRFLDDPEYFTPEKMLVDPIPMQLANAIHLTQMGYYADEHQRIRRSLLEGETREPTLLWKRRKEIIS